MDDATSSNSSHEKIVSTRAHTTRLVSGQTKHLTGPVRRNADLTTNQKLAPAPRKSSEDSPTSSNDSKRPSRSLPPAVTRKSHQKSRAGCQTCKKRHVKCDENQPQCKNCISKPDLKCVWRESSANYSILPLVRSRPKYNISVVTQDFSINDLQSLHHFLIYCPPHLPLGSAGVWKRAIPQLAHKRPVLMKAILGLGSTHATRISHDRKAQERALAYRDSATKGLNELISQAVTWTTEDVDTVLATCYALLFQATHLPGCLNEYLTHVRGCTVLTEHVKKSKFSTAFDLSTDRVTKVLLAKVEPLMVDCQYEDLINEAIQACTELQANTTERADNEYVVAIRLILISVGQNLAFGLIVDIDIYALWYHLGEAYMKVFIRQDSPISKIMLSYLMAIRLLIHVVLPWRWWPETVLTMPPGQLVPDTIQVIEVCDSFIPEKLQHLMEWPRQTLARIPDVLKEFEATETLRFSRELQTYYLQTAERNAHVLLGDVMRLCTCLTGWFEELLRYKVKIEEMKAKHNGVRQEEKCDVSVDGVSEMLKRINVYEQRVDTADFPSAAVAGSFWRNGWP